jgi:hypothetical protein
MAVRKDYVQDEWGPLVGRTIKSVREMTEEEVENMGWYVGGGSVPVVFTLDDGTVMVPSQDPEGNGPGHIYRMEMEDLW